MAITQDHLQRANAQYTQLTGEPVKHFVCPITLRDDPTAELCGGHILNDAIQKASRATVIQYKDVDNHFGTTIEPELVNWLNLPVSTPEELIGRAKSLKIMGPCGEEMEAFWGSPKSRERFQQIELYKPDGSTFSTPFLRHHKLEPRRYNQMPIEWVMAVNTPSVDAAFVKAAYLAMFRMFGYQWVRTPEGDKVRRHLAQFFTSGGRKQDAATCFADFRESNWVVVNGMMDKTKDTLEGGSLLFHFAEGRSRDGLMFGVSCLFHINNIMAVVTLPCHNRDGHYFVAFDYYQKFLRDHAFPHNIYFGRFTGDQIEIDEEPLRMYVAEKRPPNGGTGPQISPSEA